MNATSEVLLKAADIIKEKGLNKNGDFFGPDGSCCAVGAIKLAAEYDGHSQFRAISRLHMQLVQDHGQSSIPLWSDEPETTQDDVIALLRRAAENVP